MVQYNQTILKKDAQGNVIQNTFYEDMKFRGEYSTNDLIYRGYARPGASESDEVWQIARLTYVSNNVTEINWPQDSNGNASSEFNFAWADRATYTYS